MSLSAGTTSNFVKSSASILALTILLSPAVYAKKASFDMPACDRMTNGQPSGQSESAVLDPQPIMTTVSDDTATTKPSKSRKKQSKADQLKPMSLNDDSPAYVLGKDGKVKLKAERNVKNATDNPLEGNGNGSGSVLSNEAKLNSKLMNQAKQVHLMPMPLEETPGEAQQKLDIMAESDKQQLVDLWSSTMNKSPDIKFVIERMQPHSDPNHATSTVIKLLGGVLFSAAQAVPMMMGPGIGPMVAYGGIGSGASFVNNLIGSADAKNQKKQQISQEQATMLYQMVRNTADKLVIEFRNYKKCRSQYDRSLKLLEDIKAMVGSAGASNDAAEQIRMEYTVRKAQHDVDDITDDARLHRQLLSDLAGPDAIAKLDEQIDEETTAIANATGGDTTSNPDDKDKSADQVLAVDKDAAKSGDKKNDAGKPGTPDSRAAKPLLIAPTLNALPK